MLFRRIRDSLSYRITQYIYKRNFGHIGEKSIIYAPLKLNNTQAIYIGDRVCIHDQAWLMGQGEKSLEIKDDTTIGHFSHIIAMHHVEIQEKVLIADKVFISDCSHGYEDINVPIIDQKIVNLDGVRIGRDSWIGENVCILGASVGKHCVIAANAVVVKDIPDYSVAAGVPARVIKKYDFETNTWKSVKNS